MRVGDRSIYDYDDDGGEWSGGSGHDGDSPHRYRHMSPVAVDRHDSGRHFVNPSVKLPSHRLSTRHPVMYTAASVAGPVVYTARDDVRRNYVSSAALLSSECLLVVVIAAAVCSFIAVHHCLSVCTVT